MDDSKTDANCKSSPAETPGLARSAGELWADVLSLVELQARLGWEDFRTATRQAATGATWVVVAFGCALGGLPILLFGMAEILVAVGGCPRSVAYLTLGLVAVLGSAGAAYYGVRLIIRTLAVFQRSRDELLRNLVWLKQVSRQSTATWNERKQPS